LASPKCQQDNQVELLEKKAPPTAPSGFSSTIKFVFQLGKRPGNAQVLKDQNDFLSLRGIAKDLFQSVGGGEAFLKKERVAFKDVSDRLEPARQGK